MLPVATKLSGGAAVGESAGVADGMAAELAIADGVALVLAELLVVLPQPASPMAATTPTSAIRKPGDNRRDAPDRTVLGSTPELVSFVIAIDSLMRREAVCVPSLRRGDLHRRWAEPFGPTTPVAPDTGVRLRRIWQTGVHWGRPPPDHSW